MTISRTDVRSPVSGIVWDVRVRPSQTVTRGGILLIVEVMKVEVPLIAAADGTVRRVLVARGDLVEAGQPLVVVADSLQPVPLHPVAIPGASSSAGAPDDGGGQTGTSAAVVISLTPAG
jgi:multidrug resistance efflux pump